jgi:ribonuclease HII
MREFGVDEAGKGPVLGSMFAAAVVADPGDLPGDVGDSKDIVPQRREELAAAIREVATAVGVAEVTVERIDDAETDMNSLTVAAHAEALVAALGDLGEPFGGDGENPLPGYVDAGDTNAVRFERRVTAGVTDRLSAGEAPEVRGEHGADEAHPIVGAASIVAKVERDAHVDRLAAEYGDLGSGYPSDSTTRSFLDSYVAEHDTLPPCARRSWKTSRDVLADAAQSSLGEFESDGGRAGPEPTTFDDG